LISGVRNGEEDAMAHTTMLTILMARLSVTAMIEDDCWCIVRLTTRCEVMVVVDVERLKMIKRSFDREEGGSKGAERKRRRMQIPDHNDVTQDFNRARDETSVETSLRQE
jgi:hypothetical protein